MASKFASRLCRRPDIFLDRILLAHDRHRSWLVCSSVLHGDLFCNLGLVLRSATATSKQEATTRRNQMGPDAHPSPHHRNPHTIAMHAIVQHGYWPRSQNADEQTIEVVRRFGLSELIAPFTRCLRCNGPLEAVAKADVIDKLEPLTKIYYDQFRRCPGCNRIYWSGSHFLKLRKRIEEIRSRALGKA